MESSDGRRKCGSNFGSHEQTPTLVGSELSMMRIASSGAWLPLPYTTLQTSERGLGMLCTNVFVDTN